MRVRFSKRSNHLFQDHLLKRNYVILYYLATFEINDLNVWVYCGFFFLFCFELLHISIFNIITNCLQITVISITLRLRLEC